MTHDMTPRLTLQQETNIARDSAAVTCVLKANDVTSFDSRPQPHTAIQEIKARPAPRQ